MTTKRNLPHIYRTGEDYFITFRLYDSIPKDVMMKMKEEYELELIILTEKFKNKFEFQKKEYNLQKKFFAIYDNALHENIKIQYLENEEIAELVGDAMKFYHEEEYFLIAYCIMSNHVHFVFHYYENATRSISEIMKSIKGYTARKANIILGRTGNSFWQHESYDHIIRDNQELDNIIDYVKMNPVKAGLIDDWQKWKYTYFNEVF